MASGNVLIYFSRFGKPLQTHHKIVLDLAGKAIAKIKGYDFCGLTIRHVTIAAISIARRFPRLALWESGKARPTRSQLERFAKATHSTVDHLLLAKPPVERVPIPDFRAAGNVRIGRPSPNLLDTLSLCRQRQAWYRDFTRVQSDKPLAFAGSASLKSDIAVTAAAMRSALGLDLEERQKISAWDKILRRLIDYADALGILVMVNGVVGNNSSSQRVSALYTFEAEFSKEKLAFASAPSASSATLLNTCRLGGELGACLFSPVMR